MWPKLFTISEPTARDKQAETMPLFNTHGTFTGPYSRNDG